jgi:hypothetical protein
VGLARIAEDLEMREGAETAKGGEDLNTKSNPERLFSISVRGFGMAAPSVTHGTSQFGLVVVS